jgi:glyoxylase-like metal-dependent hydrolase (beta-lactamase superfamily II)/8-oxo-dGTP pyrophosphatase MutT (NUDIX family)
LTGSAASPRKSAVAIPLTRGPSGELRALVGRRRSRFLGGFFAFPGGAHEPEDGDVQDEPEDAALRRTAARELREETGIAVVPEDLLDAGRRVTPPFFPRRFDTAMYVAALDRAVEPAPEVPGEMESLEWCRPADVSRRWRELEIRVAPPLIPILQELARVGDDPWTEIAGRLARCNEAMEGSAGPHIEFVPDVLMVPVSTVTLPPATTTNCYLVGARDFVILDPGAGGDEADRLLRHVRRRAEGGRRPKAIVVTHHHADHVGGAAELSRRLDVPVMAHPVTWDLWDRRAVGARAAAIREGDLLELSGGERLRVLHTPGHAAGHVALLEEASGSLFAGDLVSGLSTVLVDSAPGALDDYLASLERIRDAGAKTLFPAHGPPMIAPARDVQKVLDHRRQREERILEAIAAGASRVSEIVERAYADTPEAPAGLRMAQAAAHLDRLLRQGRVRCVRDRWRAAN